MRVAGEWLGSSLGVEDTKLEVPELDEFLYEFKYTTPNVLSSLHKAIKLGYDFYNNNPSNGFAINFE